jgi:hypothetical protein
MNTRIVFSLLFFAMIAVFIRCNKKSNSPTGPNEPRLSIDSAVVLYDSLGATGGPGYYYKNIIWYGEFDPSWADSVFTMLIDSSFALVEFWYPDEPGMCLDPSRHEREIVKLSAPDSNITRLGYTPFSSNYLDGCIQHWRQYKFLR